MEFIPPLKCFSPYILNLILHLNKKIILLIPFFFLLIISLQIFTSIEGVSLQNQNKKKIIKQKANKMQQLKCKDSVAVEEPVVGSEVRVSCFLSQALRYLFSCCWACLSKVSKSSAFNLLLAGVGSYSLFESENRITWLQFCQINNRDCTMSCSKLKWIQNTKITRKLYQNVTPNRPNAQ